jgi:NAD+ synthase
MNLTNSFGIPHRKVDISPIIRDLGAYDLMSHEEASDREAIERSVERGRIIPGKEFPSTEHFSPTVVQ